MRHAVLALLAAMFVVGSSSDAKAILIVRNAGADALNSAFSINSVSIDNTVGVRTISIDLNVLKAHIAGTVGFKVTGSGVPGIESYTVTITTTNMVPTPGLVMSGFDVDVVTGGGQPLIGLSGTGTSDKFYVDNTQSLPAGFRFGGLAGGGGQVLFGQTAISTTGLDFADPFPVSGPKNFSLKFTANPEPATLLLASMALVPGGLALRRRRKASEMLVV